MASNIFTDNINEKTLNAGVTVEGVKLENGQVKIPGGAPALGKVLTSDVAGLATWGDKTGNDEVTGLLSQGLAADRPVPATAGRLYYSTDTKVLERDTGAAWEEIARGETAIRLAQLAEKAHTSLTGVTADDHHARLHDHSLAADGTPIAMAGVPNLDVAKITSGIFGIVRGGTGLSVFPKRTIILTAAGGWPSTTAGCAVNAKAEYVTNDIDLYHLDFDAAVRENAQWTIAMPDSYDGGTITAKFIWTSTGTSGNVIWGIQGRAFGDLETIDQAWGAAVVVTDTQPATANQVLYSAVSGAITLAGTPAGGEMVQFRVYRDAGNAGDTLAVDARLISVVIEYTLNSWTD